MFFASPGLANTPASTSLPCKKVINVSGLVRTRMRRTIQNGVSYMLPLMACRFDSSTEKEIPHRLYDTCGDQGPVNAQSAAHPRYGRAGNTTVTFFVQLPL